MKNLMFCMLLILFSFPAIVDANEPVVGITMNKLSTSIHVGGTDQLQAIFAPDVIWHFTWSSSNPAVASVNAQHPEMGNAYGLVTGISPGTATITATRIDGVGYATCVVTVYDVPANIITMNKLSTSIHVGGTDQLQAIFAPDVIWHFTWNSSNPAVASVNAQHPEMGNAYGLVTGISPGTATITATRIDGVGYATCVVTVYDGNNSRGGCNALNYGIIGFSLIFTILLNARKNKSN